MVSELEQAQASRAIDQFERRSARPRQICYVLGIEPAGNRGWPCVSLWQRPIKKDGTPGKLKVARLLSNEVAQLESDEDRSLIGLLVGNRRSLGYGYGDSYSSYSDFAVNPALFDVVFPRLAAAGRFGWLPGENDEMRLLSWDDGPAWHAALDVSKTADGNSWQLTGKLVREGAVEPLGKPLLILAAGLVVFEDRIARFEDDGAFAWVVMLRQFGSLAVPVKQEQEFVEALATSDQLPRVELPGELRWQEQRPAPVPQVTIAKPRVNWFRELECRLTFHYGEHSARLGADPPAWYDRRSRSLVRRDAAAEKAAFEQLLAAGARRDRYYGHDDPSQAFVAPEKMNQLALRLLSLGWQVEAEGRPIRSRRHDLVQRDQRRRLVRLGRRV